MPIVITQKDRKAYRLESQLLPKVRERLTALGAKCLHVHGEARQEKAVDLIICYRGIYCAIELKVGTNTATELQAAWLADVRRAGGVSDVAWTVADCLEILQEIDQRLDGSSDDWSN